MTKWEQNFDNVTWEKYIDLAFSLAEKINSSHLKLDLIIAIARGGLTLSQLLSDSLNLPIASFTVESYKDLKQVKIPHVTYGLDRSLQNRKVLLVDDVCDSGKTFLRGIRYLESLAIKKTDILTASLHLKPHAQFTPDFFISKTEKWVIYPYEVRETIVSLSKIWQKQKLSKAEMTKRFLQLKFPPNQVKKYFED